MAAAATDSRAAFVSTGKIGAERFLQILSRFDRIVTHFQERSGHRHLMIMNIADQWTDKDAVAASGWIATLPQGEERDAAAAELITDIRPGDPAAALQWAGNMQDASMRLEWQAKAFGSWF